MYPALVIHPDLPSLEPRFVQKGYPVFHVFCVDDLKRVIRELQGVRRDLPVVISDLAALTHRTDALLKFLEESCFSLICLSSEDRVSDVLLSRFGSFRKLARRIPHRSRNFEDLMKALGEETDPVEAFTAHSPTLLGLHMQSLGFSPVVRAKLLRLCHESY